ncbi:MAG: tannase/feruloyl esterase family alpha/beta hydrolase [Acidobacteria bacterium]|nr:tannase/feruloyl esterase family alpha/beta hydrolase [Acidobacteriota bacterium]
MRFSLCLIALGAFAQNAPHIREWKPDPSESTVWPKAACAELHRLTGYDLSVMTVDVIAAGAGTPEFCRVLIQAQPEIRIEVSLPANWNRRLYMFGNGGFAGENLEAPGRVAHRNAALKLGFAVTQTNTGHDAAREPLATFTVNQQKLLDYAFRSLHVTVETAKRAVEAHYGSRPMRSYYNGCSTGGRQGLILAQRYPEDFDGIIVGAPALNNVAIRLRSIATFQALSKAPISPAKLKLLADRVYAKCDAGDGLKDGLIDDPRRCDFQASRDLPVCSGGDAADCFTAAQVKVLDTIYKDVVLNGKRVAPGFPLGAEIAGPNGDSGWNGWILREGQLSQSALFAESALRYMVFSKPDPAYELSRFNLERDAPSLDWIGKLMNATDPDLSRFRQRGGKILMYFGWADPALNPLMGVEYYEDVVRTMGASTRDFFRLYMLPGVFHCGGGVGPACFDPLANLIPWVEREKAPGQIVASRMEGGKALRTRPLCPYPQVAQYQGQGSPDDAANFRCSDPR